MGSFSKYKYFKTELDAAMVGQVCAAANLSSITQHEADACTEPHRTYSGQ